MSKERSLFEKLYRKYKDPLYGYLVQSVGRENAEDLLQETYIKVFKNIKKYDSKKSEASWIYTIARNTLVDFYRKRNGKGGTELDDYYLPSGGKGSEEIDNSILIRNAIKKLVKKRQEVIVLYYFQQLSYKEISEVLECSINTVKSRLSRAKSDLKEILK